MQRKLILWLFFLVELSRMIPGRSQPIRSPSIAPHDPSQLPEVTNNLSSVCTPENNNYNYNLPSMKEGGLVFFLHIPKTGGTTIRQNLQAVENIHYVLAKNYSTYYETAPLVEELIVRSPKNLPDNKPIVVYEVHATTAPSFYKLRKRLKRWRTTASHYKVPVFFFTVVRDPLAFSFSHFNFFHLQKRNRTFERCKPTEDDFLRKSLYNPQCQFLYKGEPSMRGQKRNDTNKVMVQPEDCRSIQETMFDLLDWVGTTEQLSSETLPLLSKLLDLEEMHWENHRVSKEQKNYISFGKENLSPSAIEQILEISKLDTEMYEAVQRKYRYTDWMAPTDPEEPPTCHDAILEGQ